jgi:hypothetical protein
MERFVFVAAVTIALIWGAIALFGDRFIHFNGDWDIDADARMAPLVEVSPGNMAARPMSATASTSTIWPPMSSSRPKTALTSSSRSPTPRAARRCRKSGLRAGKSPSMAASAAVSSAARMAAPISATTAQWPLRTCRASQSAPRAA